jgi:hypothetical protein
MRSADQDDPVTIDHSSAKPNIAVAARQAGHIQPNGAQDSAHQSLKSNVVLGALIAIADWPLSTATLRIAGSLDPSWRAALALAEHYRLPFGTHIAFTYGPLGFLLSTELLYTSTAVFALLFALAFSTAVYASLLRALRPRLPLLLAIIGAYLIGGVARFYISYGTDVVVDEMLAIVMVLAVMLLTTDMSEKHKLSVWVGLGVILTISSLITVSLFPPIAVSLAITLLCLPSRRIRSGLFMGAGAISTFCIAWFGTGSGINDISPFARSSISLVTGYAGAMEVEDPARWYAYWLALLAAVVIIALAVLFARHLPARQAIGVVLLTVLTLWFLFKESFVRHDVHDLIFFASAPLLIAAFAGLGRARLSSVVCMVGLSLIPAILAKDTAAYLTSPTKGITNFVDDVRTLASARQSRQVVNQSRRALRSEYGFDGVTPAMIRRIGRQTADFSPWDQVLAWAYPQIRFDPLPVFQDYAIYTAQLDSIDANYLASSQAPKYILRRGGLSVDGKDPYFEGPLTQLTIECRYSEVEASSTWQLLERGADRCGQAAPVETVVTGNNRWVTVPAAPQDSVIVASFRLSLPLWSTAESLLYKPGEMFLALNTPQSTVRFVGGTATDPHILRTSASLGYSPQFVPQPISRLRFSIPGAGSAGNSVTVSFSRVSIKP